MSQLCFCMRTYAFFRNAFKMSALRVKIFVHLVCFLPRHFSENKPYQTNYDTFIVKYKIDIEILIVMVI